MVKGWEKGMMDMCVGEKRKLIIPPHLGYGDEAMGEWREAAGRPDRLRATGFFLTKIKSKNYQLINEKFLNPG